ncbi:MULTISPECIES: helix-turn-helix domain-containing protein [Massilia]|uniref:Helix-turn-helix domain-containing protein n=1 Tax=Massilia haematophila TaxID=457923 RepID=A0ABV7PK96_9BURK|nr:helix-turn-helix transcriptional regulator [Massilia sp.]HBZ05747.1 transcriptional regulator [Massilia sp.]
MPNDFVCESMLARPTMQPGAMPAAIPAALPQPPRAAHVDLRQFRISKRESQEKFWGRFGVTQSSGSRFETGLAIPAPVAILLKLYVNGKLNDGDLQG